VKQVLIVLPNDSLGGAEQYLKNIAIYFLKNGFSVKVFFLKKKVAKGWEDLEVHDNSSIHYTNSKSERSGFFSFLRNISKYKNNNFDYIFTSHVHLTGIIGFLIRLKLLKKTKFIGRESTSIFQRFKGLKLLFFRLQYYIGYNALDLLICQTDVMHDQLKTALPSLFEKVKIRTIPNPVDLDKIIRAKIDDNLPFENFIVGAGRLINEKGFDILIEAFFLLKKEFPDIKLVIIGEGQLRSVLETRIKELNLGNDVFLPGFVNNVYSYFNQAELCVVSSRIEGFPNVLLQMMSQNSKVVSTLCAGGIDKLLGIRVVRPNDISDLYEGMKLCLNEDTFGNHAIFETELASRSIESFIISVDREVSNSEF